MSKSILEKADTGAANVDCFCILPEKRIVDDSIFSWVAGFEEAVSTESFDYEKENSGIENPVNSVFFRAFRGGNFPPQVLNFPPKQ